MEHLAVEKLASDVSLFRKLITNGVKGIDVPSDLFLPHFFHEKMETNLD